MLNEENKNLRFQLEKTLAAMTVHLNASEEVILAEYLKKYQDALLSFELNSQEEKSKKLKAILGCARGYMEYSSNYEQQFLQEMWKTERIAKQELGRLHI
ncbi:hypothetical protein [Pseudomonas syringae]|uniref:hypothetical protein n=1 Tax=Pseudomonas syringae TaxID=317 RepID=UPI000464F692|nr:hypothetical protein [Pseudomonas syringae]KTB79736.1 hypothetical protein AO070_20490 [Pseudomonas syringae pv. syringae PD2766]